jgi:hypothetical protein
MIIAGSFAPSVQFSEELSCIISNTRTDLDGKLLQPTPLEKRSTVGARKANTRAGLCFKIGVEKPVSEA